MTLPAYQRYKPSGVQWLGDVPEHWDLSRFRFCVISSNAGEVIDRSFWHSGEDLLFSCQRESMVSDFPDFPEWKRTTLNDLLVTRNGTPYVHVPPANAIYSNVVQRCTLKSGILRSFIALALETACERLRGDGYGVSIPSFSYEKWCDLPVAFPPIAEQHAIAAFLGQDLDRVDRLVSKKRELIERLKEKRTALISRAVTRGLPPSAARAAGLPEDPPLKSSGLDWLGDIPKHWEVSRVRYESKFVSKGTTPSTLGKEMSDDGIRFLKAENISNGIVCRFPEFFIDEATDRLLLRSRLSAEDVLVVIAGATTGKAAVLSKEFLPANTNQAVCFIRPKIRGYATILAAWISSPFIQDLIWNTAVQAAQPNLAMGDVRLFPV